MESFWELQSAFNILFQSLGSWLEFPMRLFTFLGEEQFFMLVMPAVYWCLDAGLGIRLGIILLTSSTLNHYLKLAFHTPRPYWVNPQVKAYVLEPSFGMPSGHSQNSASLWGRIAAAAPRTWIRVILILLVVLIGLSRLFLGVHSIMDVLTGWTVGAALVWVFLRLEKPAAARLAGMRFSRQVGAAFAATLGLILVEFLILVPFGAWNLPGKWIENSSLAGALEPINPLSPTGIFSGAGTIFGLLAGAAWLRHVGGFSASGTGWRLAARYIFGVAGVVLIWSGLDQVFPDGADLVALSLRYIRYALSGLWIGGIAPYLFIRFGWASSVEESHEVEPMYSS